MGENILILGGGLQAISVARSLKDAGYNPYCIVEGKNPICYSNYVKKIISISKELDVDFIKNSIEELSCSVVIPMSDRTAEFLSVHRDVLESKTNVKCAVVDYSIFSKANNKGSLLSICLKNNIPHPRTAEIELEKLTDVSQYVGFPSLIKPNFSVGARGITLVLNEEDIKQKLPDLINQYGSCTLQEYIEQKGRPYYNVILYRDRRGMILASTILEIQRYYPLKGGSSCFGVTIENKELVSICQKVLEILDWWGVADFDVLSDENGNFKIIELNPRVPASVRAAAISGINFPDIIVRDCLGIDPKRYTYQPGKELRFLGLDIMWFLASPQRFKVKPNWFKFLGKNLFYQEGGYKDWKSMGESLLEGVKKVLNPSFRKSKEGI